MQIFIFDFLKTEYKNFNFAKFFIKNWKFLKKSMDKMKKMSYHVNVKGEVL